jgi:acyl dehydratase
MTQTLELVLGQEFSPRTFDINRTLLVAYANASGDHNPIHQNEDFAKSVGLPNVIAHGMLTMALAGKYLSDIVGSSARIKEFGARFIKPVIVPVDVEVKLVLSGKVTSVEPGLVRIELTVMCNDEKVLSMARAVISVP